MKYIILGIVLAASGVLAAETNLEPQVIFRVAAARSTFGTNDDPLHLVFTFLNVGNKSFILCPNRIENQNTIKFMVRKSSSDFPTNTLDCRREYRLHC